MRIEVCIFQSTLPIQGEAVPCAGKLQDTGISIHSPYTGRGLSFFSFFLLSQISIHSPYTGRGILQPSHSPPCRHFNPLSLYRERRVTNYQIRFPNLFQSTLPIQGEAAILHIKPLIYSQSLMQNAKQKNFFQHLHNKL